MGRVFWKWCYEVSSIAWKVHPIVGRMDLCREISFSNPSWLSAGFSRSTWPCHTQGGHPAKMGGMLPGGCYTDVLKLALAVDGGKWTGNSSSREVWMLFSRDMMWMSSLSWRSASSGGRLFLWSVEGPRQYREGAVSLCITVAFKSGHRSLWSSWVMQRRLLGTPLGWMGNRWEYSL